MLLEAHTVGNIDITNDTLDITDPMYSKDVWCRMNDISIQPGNYDCIAYFGSPEQDEDELQDEFQDWAHKYYNTFEEYKKRTIDDITHRIFALSIVLNDTTGNPVDTSSENWECIGSIGVDSGLAGFIWDQNALPHDNNDAYDRILNIIDQDETETFYDEDTDTTLPHIFHIVENFGFFSSSGYGDGGYDVYAISRNGKTVAIRIDFT